jgi:diaminopropionate ammonia-lyase
VTGTGTAVPRAVVNGRRDPLRVPPPAGEHVREFHRQLPGYRPSPLHRPSPTPPLVAGVGAILQGRVRPVWAAACKILGASWAVEQTLRARPEVRKLVAASSGKSRPGCRTRAAAQRFLACDIYLPAATSRTRAELIGGEGAQVVRVEGGYEDAVRLAVQAAAEPGTALVEDTALDGGPAEEIGGSAVWVVEGYSTLFREVDEQAPAPLDVVMVPVGVGSLAAATVRWAAHRQPPPAVIAVEPTTAACLAASLALGEPVVVPTPGTAMAGLNCATPSAAAWPTLRDGLVGAVSVSDGEARQAIRDLASRGLTIGDCGAATLAALRALVEDPACAGLRAVSGIGPASTVLCIGSEGASDPDVRTRRPWPKPE